MWDKDFKNYSEEERRLHDKINKINRDNQDFLKRQMEEKQIKIGKAKMNKQEFLLNKPLLKEINDKLRATNYGGSPSKAGDLASRMSGPAGFWGSDKADWLTDISPNFGTTPYVWNSLASPY